MTRLEKDRVLVLLEEADTKWFGQHLSSRWNYREHLEFTAEYLSKKYDKSQNKKDGKSKDGSDKVHRLL